MTTKSSGVETVMTFGLSLALLVIIGQTLAASIQGLKSEAGNERIIGGHLSENHGRPYMALVKFQIYIFYGGRYHLGDSLCGGSIISDRWIVTAAHCIDYSGQNYTVHVGMNTWCNGSIKNPYYSDGHVARRVSKMIIHPKYSPTDFDNDIALIKMDQAVPLGGNIQTIRMPIFPPVEGQTMTVAGWGDIVENSTVYQCYLMEVDVKVFPYEKCMVLLNNDTTHFCANDVGKDSCQGDSGGGLVSFDAGIHYLEGVVSYGFGCGRLDSPGFYTKVIYYIPWINETMDEN